MLEPLQKLQPGMQEASLGSPEVPKTPAEFQADFLESARREVFGFPIDAEVVTSREGPSEEDGQTEPGRTPETDPIYVMRRVYARGEAIILGGRQPEIAEDLRNAA